MLGFGALAEVALAEIPGTGVTAQQVSAKLAGTSGMQAVPFSRVTKVRPQGKLIVIDFNGHFYGSAVSKNEPFVLLVNFGELIPPVAPILKFTSPTGKVQFGDDTFSFFGNNDIDYLPIPFKGRQTMTYVADVGEFRENGFWFADITVGNLMLSALRFYLA